MKSRPHRTIRRPAAAGDLPGRRHRVALAIRVAPVGVLAMGLLILSAMIPSASAQYPYNGGGNNFQGGRFGGQNGYAGQPQPGFPFGQATNPATNPATGQTPGAAVAPQARIARSPNAAAAISNAANNNGGIPPAPVQPSATSGASGGATDGAGGGSAAGSSDWQTPKIVDRILSGGWLMLPLGLCSLIVLVLSIERLVALRRSRVIPRPFVRRFTECVEDGQLSYDEATSICEEFDCPVAEVFRAAVRRWGRPMMEIEQAVMDAGDRVNDSLRRFVRVFHAISNVAPLLGLLGTVLGMIEAFEMMGNAESLGRPEMLASGISMALVTTAGGLSVAIPAYLAYMYFSAKSDRYLGEIDKLCTRVVDSISAEALESESKSRPRKRAA